MALAQPIYKTLPLPTGWEELITEDGRILYVEYVVCVKQVP